MNSILETVPAVLEQSAERFKDRPAILDGDVQVTYGELFQLSQRVARALVASGVKPGDRIAIWSPNTFHWIAAAIGGHSAGAALVPLNTRFTGPEAIEILERSSVRVLFVPGQFLGRDYLEMLRVAGDAAEPVSPSPVNGLPELELVVEIPIEPVEQASDTPGTLTWDAFLELADGVSVDALPQVSGDDVADILFTSGTTGRPKGAMSSHRQTVAVAVAWAERAEVTDRDVYLIINPFFHSFGYKAGWLVSLLCGATLIPQLTFDVDRALRTIDQQHVTLLPGPPTLFQSLLAHPNRDSHNLSSLRLAVTGSAIVPVALIERMVSELTFESILTAYGLSEAVVVTMCLPGDDPETISKTSGCATADFELRVVDADGAELPAGEDGEIQLRGPNVMIGYLDDPAATRAAIEPDGWLHTGDIGHLDERGYLTITDRLKDMFTTGGFNVYPAEVENAILRLPGVVETAVVEMPEERLGQVGLAFIVTHPDYTLTEEDVINHCRGLLANFKLPRKVVFLPELPHNAAGKVLKRELRDRVPAT